MKIKKKIDKWILEQVEEITSITGDGAAESGEEPAAEAGRLRRIQRLEGLGLGKLRGILTFLAFPGLLLATGRVGPPVSAGTPSPPPPASPAGPVRLDRIHWKPRVSVVGVVAGLMISAGIVLLLQQYSEVYPTRQITVVGLLLGLATGLTLPSIFRLYDVWRANRAIAGAEGLLNEELRQRRTRAQEVPGAEESAAPGGAEETSSETVAGVSDDAATPQAAEPKAADERSGGENAGAAGAEDALESSEGD